METRRTKKAKGFTLVEIMAVVVIIALLAGLVAVNVIGSIGKAYKETVKAQMAKFEDAIKMFRMDTGRYPTDLNELVQNPGLSNWGPEPYMDRIPNDPWNNPYVYEYIGEGTPPYRITSYGADGQPGGTGDNADLTNIELLHGGEGTTGTGR
jgi:general secretion pathway protein G